jgi:ABC-type antimicrobial peptide transport system permease subunit
VLVAAIRRIVASVDPNQPLSDVRPLTEIVDGETTARVVQVRVLAGFAALAVLLAAVGLNGLLSFVVSARTREFGVRLALGAAPREILALVTRRGLVLGLAGSGLGLAAAYATGRWMESLLAGVSPADPLTLGATIAASLIMVFAASLLPAIRAARTNPTDAMRTE